MWVGEEISEWIFKNINRNCYQSVLQKWRKSEWLDILYWQDNSEIAEKQCKRLTIAKTLTVPHTKTQHNKKLTAVFVDDKNKILR